MAQMNLVKKVAGCLLVLVALAMLAGCETGSGAGARRQGTSSSRKFHVGELVSIKFSGVETQIPDHEERVKEDGTVTLSQIGSVKAEGTTPGELQEAIRARYVPKYYTESFTVTVRSQDRYFYVGGEVKQNNRYSWVEGMTAVKAIQNAGGFTEWANQKKVRVTSEDQKTFLLNYDKALVKPEFDLPVEPNDVITVPRKGVF